jgi:hypothetical protein
MAKLTDILKGGDLRSTGKVDEVIKKVNSQKSFDELFSGLFDADRLVVMRSADAIEKITLIHPKYLRQHTGKLLELLNSTSHIELKWHLAQLTTRIKLNENEIGIVWNILTRWALDKKESRIVRVLSLQGLFDLLKQYPELLTDFTQTMQALEKEPVPSIAARIRILKKLPPLKLPLKGVAC